MVFTVDLGPIDRNVYNVGALIEDDYISISTYILNVFIPREVQAVAGFFVNIPEVPAIGTTHAPGFNFIVVNFVGRKSDVATSLQLVKTDRPLVLAPEEQVHVVVGRLLEVGVLRPVEDGHLHLPHNLLLLLFAKR